MPKHTFLVPADNLAAFNLPPGYSLHAPDGRPINPDQVAAYLARGEKIEIYHEGRSVGRFRQSEMADRFSPASIDVMGRMLEQAKAENFSEAINGLTVTKAGSGVRYVLRINLTQRSFRLGFRLNASRSVTTPFVGGAVNKDTIFRRMRTAIYKSRKLSPE
jgi:hypothetical protein